MNNNIEYSFTKYLIFSNNYNKTVYNVIQYI